MSILVSSRLDISHASNPLDNPSWIALLVQSHHLHPISSPSLHPGVSGMVSWLKPRTLPSGLSHDVTCWIWTLASFLGFIYPHFLSDMYFQMRKETLLPNPVQSWGHSFSPPKMKLQLRQAWKWTQRYAGSSCLEVPLMVITTWCHSPGGGMRSRDEHTHLWVGDWNFPASGLLLKCWVWAQRPQPSLHPLTGEYYPPLRWYYFLMKQINWNNWHYGYFLYGVSIPTHAVLQPLLWAS